MYKLSNRSKERISGIRPILKVIIEKAISHPKCPDDFGIPQFGGKRTVQDQQFLYSLGRTNFETHNKPVTYVDGVNKKSNHQPKEGEDFGNAFDIYIFCHKKKRASWNVERLTKLAHHIIKIAAANGVELEWGGSWEKFKDYPHFQFKRFI